MEAVETIYKQNSKYNTRVEFIMHSYSNEIMASLMQNNGFPSNDLRFEDEILFCKWFKSKKSAINWANKQLNNR